MPGHYFHINVTRWRSRRGEGNDDANHEGKHTGASLSPEQQIPPISLFLVSSKGRLGCCKLSRNLDSFLLVLSAGGRFHFWRLNFIPYTHLYSLPSYAVSREENDMKGGKETKLLFQQDTMGKQEQGEACIEGKKG